MAPPGNVKRADTSMPPDGTLNQQRVMYYSANWQLLEERIDDDWSEQSSTDDRKMQYFWGNRYIDDIIARRQYNFNTEDTDVWYHLTDAQFSTVAIITEETAEIVERISYDAYGKARHHRPADLTGNGAVGLPDMQVINGNWGEYGAGDLNRDGIVETEDMAILNADWGAAIADGLLSTTDNIIGYAGYVFNAESPGAASGYLYTVRHRQYEPGLGRWLQRDPLGYVDGMGLYEYVRSSPVWLTDPFGRFAVTLHGGCASDPFCCDNWDPICDVPCHELVCQADPYCCTAWDPICSSLVEDLCSSPAYPPAEPPVKPPFGLAPTPPTIGPRLPDTCASVYRFCIMRECGPITPPEGGEVCSPFRDAWMVCHVFCRALYFQCIASKDPDASAERWMRDLVDNPGRMNPHQY